MLTLVYFAGLRERLGVADERVPVVADVAALLEVLRSRGGAYAEALAAGKRFRVAVNHDMATPATPLADGDEVAIFPPVTGG